MSDNIPFDIQMEIIKRISHVKSLLRVRAVSKPWKDFIDSPQFIAGYGVRDTQPQSLLLRHKHYVYPNEVKYVSFVDEENDIFPQQQQQQDFAPNVTDLVKHLECSEVIGGSCGLWCLHGRNSSRTWMFVMWNPSIRKSVGIVVPLVLNKTIGKRTYYGFGVSPSTYDPTIVAMQLEIFQKRQYKVGIFTLSSKSWKMIPSSNVPRESVRLTWSTHVAIDRFIYWLADDHVIDTKNLILSFDLTTHEFKEVNLPVSNSNNDVLSYISISKLNESLVVFAYTFEVNGYVYGVWMMGEEGGILTSFKKLFNIDIPLSLRRLLGFRNSGEPIVETEKNYREFAKVKVYKPCSEHKNDFGITRKQDSLFIHKNDLGITGKQDSFFICPRTETLLLVDYSDCSIIFNDY